MLLKKLFSKRLLKKKVFLKVIQLEVQFYFEDILNFFYDYFLMFIIKENIVILLDQNNCGSFLYCLRNHSHPHYFNQ